MNRMWMVAAVPLALMTVMFYGFWMKPRWADTASPATCFFILAGAVLTGLCVLFLVLLGWWRGAYTLTRADILAATTFAALDVLIPATLVLLIWLLIRGFKNSGGVLLF